MAVFVLDQHKKPLMPCTEKRARLLLNRKRAVVHKIEPFTIRLKDRKAEDSTLQPVRLKLDPGSKTTGFAVTLEQEDTKASVLVLGVLNHKQGISASLEARNKIRRNRRNRKMGYREMRWSNRKSNLTPCVGCGGNTPKRTTLNKKKDKTIKLSEREKVCRVCLAKADGDRSVFKGLERDGRIAPSLMARVTHTQNLIHKIKKVLPINFISCEWVKFDMQKLNQPDIKGVDYQQGTLAGYTIREYLLEKYDRKCAYCHAESIPLEIEHYLARARGGSNRITNLTIACHPCNQDKGDFLPEEWVEILTKSKKTKDKDRLINFIAIKPTLNESLKDAAAVNTTRKAIVRMLKTFNFPLELASGAQTKMQRIQHDLPKEHYFDALCVGDSTPRTLKINTRYFVDWTINGRGTRQMVRLDKFGFPLCHQEKELYTPEGKRKGHRDRKKFYFGFTTGDLVKANVKKGKYIGTYKGRIAVRDSGYFNLKNFADGKMIPTLKHQDAKLVQRNDGWSYTKKLI